MSPEPARRRATYEDLLAVPDSLIAEIIDGELITSPRPAIIHRQAASTLGADLHGPFQRGHGGPGGWWILYEPELHLGEHVLVPDLAGWCRENLPALPNSAFIAIAPDWICEVLSPPTASVSTSGLSRLRRSRSTSLIFVYLRIAISIGNCRQLSRDCA
jgi:Uma2 family endonuclease